VSALLQIGLVNALLAALLACLVGLVARKLRRPALTHALWIVVLAKLVTPPIFEVPIEVPFSLPGTKVSADGRVLSKKPNPADTRQKGRKTLVAGNLARQSSAAEEHPGTAKHAGPVTACFTRIASVVSTAASVWSEWLVQHAVAVIVWVWLGGAAIWFSRQGLSALRYSRRLALATPAPAELQQQADALAQAMGLAYHPPVLIVRDVISPMLWGIGRRTRLLFPVNLLARLETESRETLIAHELAHFRRGDHWVRAFELLVSGLYWWNPIVWWARREIEIAEEECCDAWVIEQFPTTPRCYAEALLETIDFLSGEGLILPPAAVGLGRVPFLRRRLTAIMRGAAPKAMSGRARLTLVIVSAALLPWQPGLTPAVARPAAAPVVAPGSVAALEAGARKTIPRAPQGEPAVDHVMSDPLADALGQVGDGRPAVEKELTWAVAKSPNGQYSITRRGRENNVYLNDKTTGKQIDLSEYHIVTVAFSADSRTFATGGSDSTVRICVSSTGEVLQTLRGHAGPVQSVAFAHEGRVVISASRDGRLKLWNLEVGGELASLESRFRPINCLTVSHDGRWLALGTGSWSRPDGGQVTVFDLATFSEVAVFACERAVGAVAFKADNNTLVTGDWKGEVTFWDLARQQRIGTTRPNYKDAIAAAQFSPDSQALSQIDLDEIFIPPVAEPQMPSFFRMLFDRSASLEPAAGGASAAVSD